MIGPDVAIDPSAPEAALSKRGGRVGLSDARRLLRIGLRDPQHLAERLTLYGAAHLGEPSLEWAQKVRDERPDMPLAVIAAQQRTQSAKVARIDGAISGTPFLIAFIPGYLGYLWQEGRMVLRTAALYGRDPRSLATSAEVLALRGVHPTVDAARSALLEVRAAPLPEKPTQRRPLRTWVRSIYALLIFGGLLSPRKNEANKGTMARLRAAVGLTLAAIIWVLTWVFPATFMIVMSWGCESHARELGHRAISFYGGEVDTTQQAIDIAHDAKEERHNVRAIVRGTLLFLSVALPIGFVAFAITAVNHREIGWLGSIGALVALSLVIATGLVASRH